MFCSKCGINIKDEKQKKCPACSQRLPKIGNGKRFSLFKFFSLMVLCFLPIVIFVQIKKENDLQNIVEGQLKALKNNHVTEAYYHYFSKEFQNKFSLENFHEWLEDFPILFEYKRTQFAPQIIEDKEGSIKGLLIGENNDLNSIEFKLVKEDGGWKVSDFIVEDSSKKSTKQLDDSKKLLDRKDPAQNVIYQQLDSIRKNNLNDAFKFFTEKLDRLSKDFKEYTDQFPILRTFTSVYILEMNKTKDNQEYLLMLKNKYEEAEIIYGVEKDGKEWKVNDFLFVFYFRDFKSQVREMNDIMVLLENTLEDIKYNEFENVYKKHVSNQFREEISYDDLLEYFSTYPIFINNRGYSLSGIQMNIGEVIVTIGLIDSDNNIQFAEFSIGRQDKKWKIWKFTVYLQEVEEGTDDSGMYVERDSIGNPYKKFISDK